MSADRLTDELAQGIKDLPESERKEVVDSTQADADPIKEIVAPLDGLPDDAPLRRVEDSLRSLAISLDGVDLLRRTTVREAAIQKLEKVKGISAPAKLVDAAFQDGQSGTSGQQQGQPVLCEDPQPWPEAVDGATLLNEMVTMLKRFIILPPHAAEAAVLWVLHAHSLDAFSISPIFTITSPVKRSGKTLLLEFISLLVPRNLLASSISPAAFFRVIEKFAPSLLIDEGDALFKGKDNSNEELRGIIDAGHRKSSAFVVRCAGDKHEPTKFTTWCPKAIALIGKLPDTLEDRSIVIPMKRKSVGESVEKFKNNKVEPPLEILKRKAIRWANDNINKLRKIEPEDQDGLNDRATNNWEPLLAVADCVGGRWPKVARVAAKGLSSSIDEAGSTVSVQLLADLRDLFTQRNTDKLSSDDICKTLGEMEERPWSEWGKQRKPITPHQLARVLKPFDASPKTIRLGNETAKGYDLEDFKDSFSRYIPPPPQPSSFSPVTPSQTELSSRKTLDNVDGLDPSQEGNVTDSKMGISIENDRDVTAVTVGNPLSGKGKGYKERF